MQHLDHLHGPAKPGHALLHVEAPAGLGLAAAAGVGGEALYVAPGAEGGARAGQHHHPHLRIPRQAAHRLAESRLHLAGEGVARLGAVHGQGGDAVFDGFEKLVGHGGSSGVAPGFGRVRALQLCNPCPGLVNGRKNGDLGPKRRAPIAWPQKIASPGSGTLRHAPRERLASPCNAPYISREHYCPLAGGGSG